MKKNYKLPELGPNASYAVCRDCGLLEVSLVSETLELIMVN